MSDIFGTSGDDHLSGTTGDDYIVGLEGNDILIGHGGVDNFSGGAGNDTIRAGSSHQDSLDGGEGDDILDGGSGTEDSARFENYYGPVTINLVTGFAYGAESGYDTLIGIEFILAISKGETSITGDNADNGLWAYSPRANVILGGGGDDTIGEQGIGSTLDGGAGTNQLFLSREYDLLLGYPSAITSTPFVHVFTPGGSATLADGTTYANFDYLGLTTGAGDDDLTFNQLKLSSPHGLFGVFSNSWTAGAGNDTATIDLSGYSIAFRMDAPEHTLGYDATARLRSTDTNRDVIFLNDVENYRITGGTGSDRFVTGAGLDVLTGGGGDDLLSGGAWMDTARYSGLANDYQITWLSDISIRITDLRSGTPDGTDILSDIERLQWGNGSFTTILDTAPILTTSDKVAPANQTLALSSLFSVADFEHDTVTRYQLWDSSRDASSGYFIVNGVWQSAGTVIDVTAAQLAGTAFVTGTAGDNLQIRAFDGVRWSHADNAAWSTFAISPLVNRSPILTTLSVAPNINSTLALSTLFSVNDPDGDAVVKYQLWDGTRDPESGYFTVNGVKQAAGTVIEISAAQVSQTAFISGPGRDDLQMRAFDGQVWSAGDNEPWSPFIIIPRANERPRLTTAPVVAQHNETLALSSLFSASDDGNIIGYQLWDATRDAASGQFVVNGAARAAGTIIEISAAELAQTSFVAGRLNDVLHIRAFDGVNWSAPDNAAWAPFTVTVPANHAPVLTTGNVARSRGATVALSSLFSVSDADSDTITKYQLWDGTRDDLSGYFTINGVKQAVGTVIEITAAQLAQTAFVTGAISDNLEIRAFDGISWSAGDNAAWSPFTVTVPANHAPVLTTGTVNPMHGRTLSLSSLFSVSDADSDAMTRYQLWDSSRDGASGYFTVGGVKQAAGTVIDITAAQLAQTAFVTGATSDNLEIRAFDGIDWSASDNAAWSPFNVTVTPYTAPTLSTTDKAATAGQSFTLSSLISVTDSDGDTMTRYQLWDSSRDASSGHWAINGTPQAAGTVIDITAAQLAQTSFEAGSLGDSLQVRAFDGISWTAGDNASWAPFHINV